MAKVHKTAHGSSKAKKVFSCTNCGSKNTYIADESSIGIMVPIAVCKDCGYMGEAVEDKAKKRSKGKSK